MRLQLRLLYVLMAHQCLLASASGVCQDSEDELDNVTHIVSRKTLLEKLLKTSISKQANITARETILSAFSQGRKSELGLEDLPEGISVDEFVRLLSEFSELSEEVTAGREREIRSNSEELVRESEDARELTRQLQALSVQIENESRNLHARYSGIIRSLSDQLHACRRREVAASRLGLRYKWGVIYFVDWMQSAYSEAVGRRAAWSIDEFAVYELGKRFLLSRSPLGTPDEFKEEFDTLLGQSPLGGSLGECLGAFDRVGDSLRKEFSESAELHRVEIEAECQELASQLADFEDCLSQLEAAIEFDSV